jgi:hypothetical protein
MKKILCILLVFLAVNQLQAQSESYSRVRVSLINKSINQLGAAGIDVTEGTYKTNTWFEAELSQSALNRLTEKGFTYDILIPDVSKFYADRYEKEKDLKITRNPADDYPVPENWEYGSMGGFYTYDQTMEKLDFMAQQWPNLLTVRQEINPALLSHNGKPIWWVRLSDNPGDDENEPEVLYTAIHHAREGIGVQQMIYYMLYLLENYDTNEEIRTLVDNTEMYFVPVLNPDGYMYNEQTDPNGGGMWRKNRRNNGSSYGVDVNRNYGYMWGYDNDGSSPYPGDETYRGPSAFSEPENQNIKQFCEAHNFVITLNYHSAAGLLLYPWGWTPDACPDDATFFAHASMMTQDNNYTFGAGSTTIYPTNGGSDDWMYGDTENKNKIFSYTPEVGTSNDGFWPSMNRIIPLCQESILQDLLAAYLAGNYGNLTETSPSILSEKEGYFHFDVQRLGFGETDSWSVSITPLDENIQVTGGPVSFGSLEILEIKTDSISYTLRDDIESGQSFRFLLSLNNGSYTLSDTITKMYGTTTIVFEDNCDLLDNWTSPKWTVTTLSYHTPTGSITDSRNGNYQDNENNIVTMINPIEIPATTFALLSYWAKWDLESGYDYVKIEVKVEGTNTWIPLAGQFTKTGSDDQPYYDGVSGWVNEEIDLTAYAEQSIKFRFRLYSDSGVTEDGYYFDDLKLSVLDVETGVYESGLNTNAMQLTPNPASGIVEVSFKQNTAADAHIEITDLQGRLINQIETNGNSRVKIDISKIPNGIYFIRLNTEKNTGVKKLIINN